MLWALFLLPLAGALLAAAIPWDRARPLVVTAFGLAHFVLVLATLQAQPPAVAGGWIGLDPLSRLLLLQVSGIFLLCSLYAPAYLSLRRERNVRVFCGSLLALLGMMSLAVLSRHLGLMWVAIEASTLSSAPLLYFNRNRRSIEATWKYLLVGSVGIALALLGSFFLAYSAYAMRIETSLVFDDLRLAARGLSTPWLHGAIVLFVVGYGTKMGLAPMHSWKPDAYGEAPGLVGALLAGAMTSCAFLALLRLHEIAVLAGEGGFARSLLLAFGLFSMAVAVVFMVRQNDFKRLLAYSSVEHMGILALGIGIGGGGVFGSLLHVGTNGFTKGAIFLAAGNLHRAFGSKLATEVHGALRHTPISAGLLVAGLFAVTGAPPFGPFFSELAILEAAVRSGSLWVAVLFVLFLFVGFLGMATTVLQVTQGAPPEEGGKRPAELAGTWVPAALFLAVSLGLGLFLPPPLLELITEAAAYVEGR